MVEDVQERTEVGGLIFNRALVENSGVNQSPCHIPENLLESLQNSRSICVQYSNLVARSSFADRMALHVLKAQPR
jgi:hypothetical protein